MKHSVTLCECSVCVVLQVGQGERSFPYHASCAGEIMGRTQERGLGLGGLSAVAGLCVGCLCHRRGLMQGRC